MENEFDLDSIVELPFGFPGKIYRSPMPLIIGEKNRINLKNLVEADIDIVVILTPREEFIDLTGQDLIRVYQEVGMQTLSLPILDFQIPDFHQFDSVLESVVNYAEKGCNVLVHCKAGIGRTGTFLAALAVRTLGYTGSEAVEWVRAYIPHAIETQAQMNFVMDYGKRDADYTR